MISTHALSLRFGLLRRQAKKEEDQEGDNGGGAGLLQEDDADARRRGRAAAPAEPAGGLLQHDHLPALVRQAARGAEPGEAAADDHHVHLAAR